MKRILSYGGGLNSSALLAHLESIDALPDVVLFSDTGDELPATYEAVEYFQGWCLDREVPFEILRSHLATSLFDFSIKGRSMPSRMGRECSFKFKVRPIRKFLRENFPKESTCTECDPGRWPPHRFHMIIGIALEEIHRVKDSDVKYIRNEYPLVDAKIDRAGCANLLASKSMPIPPKSGCYFCPFQAKRAWVELYQNHEDLFDKAQQLEENCQRYPEFTLYSKPLHVLRSQLVATKGTTQSTFAVGESDDDSTYCEGWCMT